MTFKISFCDPFQPGIIELGDMSADRTVQQFEHTNWADYLERMKEVETDKIYYSPSLAIENKETGHGLDISVTGEPDNYKFYIFYKRPKKVKIFFGLKEVLKNNYVTDKEDMSKKDAIACLAALIRNDTDFLANKIGH